MFPIFYNFLNIRFKCVWLVFLEFPIPDSDWYRLYATFSFCNNYRCRPLCRKFYVAISATFICIQTWNHYTTCCGLTVYPLLVSADILSYITFELNFPATIQLSHRLELPRHSYLYSWDHCLASYNQFHSLL